MEADKLLIVAHPDDEALWGGMNLLLQPGWFVICSTHLNDPIRSREFFKTMSLANVTKYAMFDVKDEYTDDEDESDKLYTGSLFEKALIELSKKEWKLVLTHNEGGEYGHEHHKSVYKLVKRHFPLAKTFEIGERLKQSSADHKRYLLQYYSKTQDIAKKLYNKEGTKLRPLERQYFFNEKIHVIPSRKIPKILHQIWFGKPLDRKTFRGHLISNVEKVCKTNGWGYKLWTNDDLKKENLPIVWDYIHKALEVGEEIGQSRFAQIADLARYELLHRFGGIYVDSLFEIGPEFLSYITERSESFELIVANEDPCKLNCKGAEGKKYMSNGFFACVPGCMILKRLLSTENLNSINFESVYINRTTGPYYFRSGMKPGDKIHIIDTEKIYPFMVNDSEYRKAKPNLCVDEDEEYLEDCLHKKYPGSLTVYQSGFGGSWSW